jgi:hypothetical protein
MLQSAALVLIMIIGLRNELGITTGANRYGAEESRDSLATKVSGSPRKNT